jgi:hypothetical protein
MSFNLLFLFRLPNLFLVFCLIQITLVGFLSVARSVALIDLLALRLFASTGAVLFCCAFNAPTPMPVK